MKLTNVEKKLVKINALEKATQVLTGMASKPAYEAYKTGYADSNFGTLKKDVREFDKARKKMKIEFSGKLSKELYTFYELGFSDCEKGDTLPEFKDFDREFKRAIA